MINFPCPHCRAENEVEPDQAGQTVACYACDGEVIVPRLTARPKARPAAQPQEVIARPGFSLHFKGCATWLLIGGLGLMMYQCVDRIREEKQAQETRKGRERVKANQ